MTKDQIKAAAACLAGVAMESMEKRAKGLASLLKNPGQGALAGGVAGAALGGLGGGLRSWMSEDKDKSPERRRNKIIRDALAGAGIFGALGAIGGAAPGLVSATREGNAPLPVDPDITPSASEELSARVNKFIENTPGYANTAVDYISLLNPFSGPGATTAGGVGAVLPYLSDVKRGRLSDIAEVRAKLLNLPQDQLDDALKLISRTPGLKDIESVADLKEKMFLAGRSRFGEALFPSEGRIDRVLGGAKSRVGSPILNEFGYPFVPPTVPSKGIIADTSERMRGPLQRARKVDGARRQVGRIARSDLVNPDLYDPRLRAMNRKNLARGAGTGLAAVALTNLLSRLVPGVE